MKKNYRLIKFSMLIFANLMPTEASANAGIPMIAVTLPFMLMALIPIIVIESLVIQSPLNLSTKQAFRSSAIANSISTILGIPLTWVLLAGAQMITGGGAEHGIQTSLQKFLAVTWQSPWLLPYERNLNWMIPTAQLVLLIPFFFTSWYSEYLVVKKMNKQIAPDLIKSVCCKANLASYAFLTLFPIGFLLYQVSKFMTK